MQGGSDDYGPATLTVGAGSGVSCGTALHVLGDLGAGKAQDHPGPDSAESYFLVDGWTCPYGNMGVQNCFEGDHQIQAVDPADQRQ